MLNIIDLFIIIILVLSFCIGFKKSVIQELVFFIGTIIVLVLSFLLKGVLGNLLCNIMPFLKFDGLTSLNILFYQGISFLIIFSVLSFLLVYVIKFSKIIQKAVNLTIILWLPSKILGGIVGLLIGYIFVFVLSISLFVPFNNLDIYKESKLVDIITNKTPILSKHGAGFIDSIKESYKLSDDIGKGKIDNEEANVKLLDKLIEYNIVSKKEVNKLKEKNKL